MAGAWYSICNRVDHYTLDVFHLLLSMSVKLQGENMMSGLQWFSAFFSGFALGMSLANLIWVFHG